MKPTAQSAASAIDGAFASAISKYSGPLPPETNIGDAITDVRFAVMRIVYYDQELHASSPYVGVFNAIYVRYLGLSLVV
jgi:hypothetical protein